MEQPAEQGGGRCQCILLAIYMWSVRTDSRSLQGWCAASWSVPEVRLHIIIIEVN